MKALVAIKRVPDGNVPLRLKADGSGIDLTGMPMRINPFDETALESAVQKKEAGALNEIVAVSIGPQACQETLRHALALGADRAIRIDTEAELEPLTVARLLHALVLREQPDLLLLGKQSSDTDNAQTGPMLATLLGWPQGTFASALELSAGQARITREVEGGQEILTLPLPALITADLRLANPRYLKLPQLLQAKKKNIEILAASDLAANSGKCLFVQSVELPSAPRAGKKIRSAAELVDCLKQEGLLQERLPRPANGEPKHSHGRAVLLAEHNGTELHPALWRAVSAARQLADDISLVLAGPATLANKAASIAGVTRVLLTEAENLEHQPAEALALLLAQAVRQQGADVLLAAATPHGKAVLPRAAALLDSPMLSDVVKIVAADTFVRPVHAGEALATIRNSAPCRILSARPAAFPPATEQLPAPVLTQAAPEVFPSATWQGHEQANDGHPGLTNARVVIAGGRGLCSAAQFSALLEPLATRLNAAIGATRAAVDAGYTSNDHQIGQTGAIVAPEFYFAIGLSGAAQHLAGMRDSRIVIAINNDPAAAICRHADYILEGDLFEHVPQLLELI